MRRSGLWTVLVLSLAVMLSLSNANTAYGQAGFDDDRVMLQGFYWESYRHGHPDRFPGYGAKPWYDTVREQAPTLRDGLFDLLWLPPPSYAGELSAGYNPMEYFNLNNSYGTFQQQRSMLVALLQNGIEPVADIVINHRSGVRQWGDFKNPDWGPWAITRYDEAFTNPESELYGTPLEQRGAEEERPTEYTQHQGTTYQYASFRDIDHTNLTVRRDIIRYLLQLKSAGYRGWRYDMVHGYHARWVAVYNRATRPTFSVGEYDWDQQAAQRGWVWYTATVPGDLTTASSVFDFASCFTLKDHKGDYRAWYGFGSGIGLVGDTTDGHPWKNRAVTFLENHDTGYRTNEDGSPQEHHASDSFQNGWEVEQGYAYILTHPGVPTVYWKHYFDWGGDLREKIHALINARKVAGVHGCSTVHTQENAREQGVYAAFVTGRNGDLYVRIGGSDAQWQPYYSGYRDYREYAGGAGWKVWVKLPGNPDVQLAPLKAPLPVPQVMEPGSIEVPDELLQ
ncbi:alpha-amylase family glycosyl hydrolase [Desulforhabdus sp. TSK]|uniref:alpha-amylase family glycosyl hydrolase n=1 Tax=Desulforhabdus sp. TSK TaxID=2925014 RepID=UPI001FC7CA72|nr:alpha-amylase family glycosyl hydrolase [Desulforhabdus sp. TSK]GKT09197.1 alpha-amylase [Desulforhabdus sp. TSK]